MKIRVLLISIVIFLFSLTASAQTSRGMVTGTVTDPAGKRIRIDESKFFELRAEF